jgi:hypothetical protein
MHIAFLPEFWRLLGVTGMTKVIGFMVLVVCPNIVLAISTTILVVVWVTAVFLDVVNHLAIQHARARDWISAIIASEDVAILNAFFGNYCAHRLEWDAV